MNLYKSYHGNDLYNDVLSNVLHSLCACNYVDSEEVKSYKCEINSIMYKFPYLNSDLMIKKYGDDFATLQQRLVALANDTSSNYVYRGVNNAAYMMYSSAQRNWLDKHTVNTPNDKAEYIEYINSLIKAATPIVRPYLSKYGILCDSCNVCNSYNEIEILALMQHYESVSPFVDFSTCIYTALFLHLTMQNVPKQED